MAVRGIALAAVVLVASACIAQPIEPPTGSAGPSASASAEPGLDGSSPTEAIAEATPVPTDPPGTIHLAIRRETADGDADPLQVTIHAGGAVVAARAVTDQEHLRYDVVDAMPADIGAANLDRATIVLIWGGGVCERRTTLTIVADRWDLEKEHWNGNCDMSHVGYGLVLTMTGPVRATDLEIRMAEHAG